MLGGRLLFLQPEDESCHGDRDPPWDHITGKKEDLQIIQPIDVNNIYVQSYPNVMRGY